MRVLSRWLFTLWLCACSTDGDVLLRIPADEPWVPRAADDFVDSIGITLMPIAQLDFEHDVLAPLSELGVRHVREWAVVPGDPDDAPQTAALAQLAALGIRTHLIFEPRFGLLPEQLVAIAASMGDALESVEGANDNDANEIDLTPTEVVGMLRDLRAVIDDNGLGERVQLVDALDIAPEDKGDLSAILDFGNFERARDTSLPALDLTERKAAARLVCGGKPIMVTECGYSTSPSAATSVSEQAAAKYLLRLLLGHFDQNIARTFVDELSDGPEPEMVFMTQGLLRNDGSAKPAFAALQRLIARLSDPGPAFAMVPLEIRIADAPQALRKVLVQKRDGRHVLILWLEVDSYDPVARRDLAPSPVMVRLSWPAPRDVVAFEPLGSEDAVLEEQAVSELAIEVGDHPVLVELQPPR